MFKSSHTQFVEDQLKREQELRERDLASFERERNGWALERSRLNSLVAVALERGIRPAPQPPTAPAPAAAPAPPAENGEEEKKPKPRLPPSPRYRKHLMQEKERTAGVHPQPRRVMGTQPPAPAPASTGTESLDQDEAGAIDEHLKGKEAA